MPEQTFSFPNVAAIPVGFWRWPHISPAKEWACKGDGSLLVVPSFLDLFEKMRAMYGRPLVITSGYRSPAHDAEVGTSGTPGSGPHTTGRAMDIQIYGTWAYELEALAYALGFTGMGRSQKTSTPADQRFLHLDNLTAPEHPRPMVWSY